MFRSKGKYLDSKCHPRKSDPLDREKFNGQLYREKFNGQLDREKFDGQWQDN